MKSNRKTSSQIRLPISVKSQHSANLTSMAIGKKLLEIKQISLAGEITEMNMALWRHLK